MDEIVIKVNSRMVERILYWVLIIVLAGLLVWSYLGGWGCDRAATSTTSSEDGATGAGVDAGASDDAATTGVADGNETTSDDGGSDVLPEATCTDDEQNRDETDVDCGGLECDPCANGDSCILDRDCDSEYCDGGTCRTETSGSLTFNLDDASYTGGVSTAAKVSTVSVKIVNGLSEDFDARLDVYVKTYNDFYYLNQLATDEMDETYKPYASLKIGKILSGRTVDKVYDLNGPYLFSLSNNYGAGDDFLVQADLVNDGTGEVLKTVKKKVKV